MIELDRVIVVGNVNVDIIAGSIDRWPAWGTEIGVDSIEVRIGGQAANSAVVLSRLGFPVEVVTVAGDDFIGKGFRARFSELGIDVSNFELLKGRTPFSIAITHNSNERSFFSNESVMRSLDVDFVADRLRGTKGAHILFCGINVLRGLHEDKLRSLLDVLKEDNTLYLDTGWPTDDWDSFRPKVQNLLSSVDWFLPNEAEFLSLMQLEYLEEAGQIYKSDYTSRALIKMGSRGSMLMGKDQCEFHHAEKTGDIIDTIGAGDAFNAGFISGLAGNGKIDIATAHTIAKDWIEGKYRAYITF